MASKKKGHLTASSEWARHLRPVMKRWFWKGERSAESGHLHDEEQGLFIQSVEELLEEIATWDTRFNTQLLLVASSLYWQNKLIATNTGFDIIAAKALEKGYVLSDQTQHLQGIRYRWKQLEK